MSQQCTQTSVGLSNSVRLVDIPGMAPQLCYQSDLTKPSWIACSDAFKMVDGKPVANLGTLNFMYKDETKGTVWCRPAGSGASAGLLCFPSESACQQG